MSGQHQIDPPSFPISLWCRWQHAVVVSVLASRSVKVRDAVTLVTVVDHEAEGVVLTGVGVALLKLHLAIGTGEA